MLVSVVFEVQPRGDVHALQLLEQELAGVRQADAGHLVAVAAALAPALIAQQPAALRRRRRSVREKAS